MAAYVYDIETYPNLFMVIFINLDSKYNNYINDYINSDIRGDLSSKIDALHKIDYKVFIIHNNLNELNVLANFIENNFFIGYNNHNYDDKLLRFIYNYRLMLNNYSIEDINKAIYNLSNKIITEYTYYSTDPILQNVSKFGIFYSVDLMRTHYLDSKKISLKNVAIKLDWYRIQDLPIRPHQEIELYELQDIKDYCINDVLITRALWYAKISDIKLRQNIKEKYDLDVLSNSRSTIADKILYKLYSEDAGYVDKKIFTSRYLIKFEELIDSSISFTNGTLKEFLDSIKYKVFNISDNFDPEISINKTNYQLGVGGLHSIDIPGIFEKSNKFKYIDCDVTSYYPQIIINLNICPAHLNSNIFVPIIKYILDNRVKAKILSKDLTLDIKERESYELEQFVFKIVINSIFGKLGKDGLWLCDLAAMYKVTLNGQLYLLKLAEDLENIGVNIISANTDGLLSKVPIELEKQYYEICNNWQKQFSFNLEFTEYKKYLRRNVNSYMAICINGNIKVKGDFVYDLENDPDHLIKGFDAKIIPLALVKYFNENIPVDKTIKDYKDIYMFCKSQKVGDQFSTKFYYVDKETRLVCSKKLQKTNRYFVSKSGGSILKEDGKGRKINILKNTNVSLLNNFYNVENFFDYNIDYMYYVREVNKIINEIKGISVKTLGKTGLTLFD